MKIGDRFRVRGHPNVVGTVTKIEPLSGRTIVYGKLDQPITESGCRDFYADITALEVYETRNSLDDE